MSDYYIENEFITAILIKKITIDEIKKMDFETKCLKYSADIYEWIDDYIKTNGDLPSEELITTRYPLYKKVEIKDNILQIIEALKEGSKRERFENILRQSVKLWRDGGNVENVIAFFKKKTDKLEKKEAVDVFEITDDAFKKAEEDYLERRKAFEGIGFYGISSGLGKEFDNFIHGGWQRGNLYGLVGTSGVGKTWIKTVIAGRGAFMGGYNVFDLSMEGTVYREYYRLLSIVNGTPNSALYAGALQMDEFQDTTKKFREIATEKGNKYHLAVFGNRENYTVSTLKRKVDKIISGGNKIDIITLDYLTLMSSEDGKMNWESFIEVSSRLSNLASSYEIPIICILQSSDFNNLEDLTLRDIAQSKGIARPFDEIFGFAKVKGKNNIGRLKSMKTRDGVGQFDAYFRSNWEVGLFKFECYADEIGDEI